MAAAIALTLRDAKTDAAVRPAYFDDGYFYLMPGESKEVCFQVDCKERVDKLLLRVDGYNVELKDILLNRIKKKYYEIRNFFDFVYFLTSFSIDCLLRKVY